MPLVVLEAVVSRHSRGYGAVRRTRTDATHNVHCWRLVRVGKESFDVTYVFGEERVYLAAYRSFSGRFLASGCCPTRTQCAAQGISFGEQPVSFIERSRPRAGSAAVTPAAACKWLSKQCPAIHEYLTVSVLPSGESRTPSSVTFFVEDGLWKCCLSEKDANAVLFASGNGLEEALDNLEERLTAPAVDWRRRGGSDKKSAGKRS